MPSDLIGRTTRLVPEHLALNVPQVEAGDVELDAGAGGAGALARPLHQHLRFCHSLAAAVSPLPGPPRRRRVGSWSTSQRPGIRHARFTRVSATGGVYPKAGVQATAYCRRQ
jgi:hypothetical protein